MLVLIVVTVLGGIAYLYQRNRADMVIDRAWRRERDWYAAHHRDEI